MLGYFLPDYFHEHFKCNSISKDIIKVNLRFLLNIYYHLSCEQNYWVTLIHFDTVSLIQWLCKGKSITTVHLWVFAVLVLVNANWRNMVWSNSHNPSLSWCLTSGGFFLPLQIFRSYEFSEKPKKASKHGFFILPVAGPGVPSASSRTQEVLALRFWRPMYF